MQFKHTQIDPKTASREEIKAEIERLTHQAKTYGNIEQSVKVFINSVYGALASQFFIGYNIKIAEAITLQGQELTKYAATILNKYFQNHWHKDKELHNKLGITKPVEKVNDEVIKYGDTDSVYATFEEVVKSCGWEGDGTEFVLGLYHGRLTEYIQKCFDIFAEKYNTQNIQALELEKISASAIILAKKKYVLDLVWKDPGVTYKPQEKLSSSGVEIVQSSTPAFVRKHLNELLKIIFNEKKQLNIKNFITELKQIKENFILCDLEDISKSTSIGDYEKFITQDKEKLVIEPRCPIHVRAGGNYNYILNNSKWKNKYQLIKSGDKIRWFHSKPERQGETDVFAYQPGNFPHEFAPKIDYDMQFEKTIIDPINRFMVAMGYGKIPSNLITSTRLF